MHDDGASGAERGIMTADADQPGENAENRLTGSGLPPLLRCFPPLLRPARSPRIEINFSSSADASRNSYRYPREEGKIRAGNVI